MDKNNKKISIGIILVVMVVVGMYLILQPEKESDEGNSMSQNLTSVNSISHGHGLAVDTKDANKVYIATHYGLLVLINEKDLYQIGKSKDDLRNNYLRNEP